MQHKSFTTNLLLAVTLLISLPGGTHASQPLYLENVSPTKKQCLSAPIVKESVGHFWLPHDIQKSIFGMLDIKSMARLEQTSRSIQQLLTQLNYTHMEAYTLIAEPELLPKDVFQCLQSPYFTWIDLKKTRLPHKELIPWTSRFLLKNLRVELGIIYQLMFWKEIATSPFGTPSEQDYSLLNRTARALNDTLILMGLEKAFHRKQCGLGFDNQQQQGYWGYPLDLEEYEKFNQLIVIKSIKNGIARYALRTRPTHKPSADTMVVCSIPNAEENLRIRLRHIIISFKHPNTIHEAVIAFLTAPNLTPTKERASFWKWALSKMNPSTANFLIEHFAQQRYKLALDRKFHGLTQGWYGYIQNGTYDLNYEEIQVFLDTLVEEGNRFAIKNKILVWSGGLWGYDADLLGAFALSRKWLVDFN